MSRVLIGEPGVTYKYLGLRLFALPWSFPGRSPQTDVEEACRILGELNTYFKQMSRKLISEKTLNSGCASSCPTTSAAASMKYETTCVNGDHERLDHRKHQVGRTKNESLQLIEKIEKSERTDLERACAIKTSNSETESEPLKKSVVEDIASELFSVEDDSSGSSKQLSEVVQAKVPSKDSQLPELTRDSSELSEQDIRVSKFNSSTSPQSSEEIGVIDSCSSTDLAPSAENVVAVFSGSSKSAAKLLQSTLSSPSAGKAVEGSLGSSKPAVELSQSTPPSSDPSHDSSLSSTLSVEEGTNFNVALLNYMDPNDPSLRLKEEPYYGMGELAVSWHMDTGLIKGSTVAVYNHTETGKYFRTL